MAKSSGKTPIKAEPSTASAKHAEPIAPGSEALQSTQLTPADQRFLDRTMRLLVSIQSPAYVRRVRREGYTAAEHQRGWALWRIAAGADRPLDHWFAEHEGESSASGGEQLRLLQEIDAFENTWFPRTRAIIRRMVPRDARDEFAAAFFTNLEQQPLGPGVVGSVSTFLARVADLAKSSNPHAKKVRATLDERGLTQAKLESVKELLAQASHLTSEVPAPKSDAAAISKAQAAQIEGLADLRDWFNDWATALRSVFNASEQIRLGLTLVKRAGASEAEESDSDEEDAKAGEDATKAGDNKVTPG
jgi:transcriptional regulator with XRE-family HTH domain